MLGNMKYLIATRMYESVKKKVFWAKVFKLRGI